jgi:hypothetical protein
MLYNSGSLVQPEVLITNKMTIHHFLRESYAGMNRHMEKGVSFLKNALFEMNVQGVICISNMLAPVNNFLKDLAQIEADFLQEKDEKASLNWVPIEVALQSPMEENY